ncbi:C-terminal domain of homeodomain 1-domain-containing protein [Desarmillaria ectypa]|nr:C-terminal domain of homeodomain 1-domain-containing protein [Desarmillaria ectypa]
MVLPLFSSSGIGDQLLSALNIFFVSQTRQDDSSISECSSQLDLVFRETLQSHSAGTLDANTLNLAYSVADTIDVVCQTLMDLNVSDNNFSKFDQAIACHRSSLEQPKQPKSQERCQASYIESAYRWLSENLHNPYPNREVRNKICRETNTSRKDLDNWFTNARRRMGWTSLLKHFDGDRDRMVEAATTYFSGQTCPWDNQYSPVDIAFADMASTLKDLYANKFEQSTLGRKLGGVVKNMTPELQEQEQVNKKRREEQREAERRAKKVRMEKAKKEDARRAYPSPDRSPGRPPDPSLPSEATPTTRKRRISDDDEDSDNDAHRSKKRSRTDDNDDAVTSLPSPSPTDTEDSDSSRDSTPTPSPSKRKRRLSDSDGAGTFKRHRGIHGSHRSVSDPSSSTSAKTECRPVELYVPPDLEGWFETALAEFPPDPEADVFNYSAMSPSSHYSDEASSAGPSTPRLATPVELPANSIAPSMTLLNNGSILDSISTPEFSISGLDLEGLLPAAIPAEKQPLVSDPAHLSDLDAFLASFSGNNLFSASPDFADIDFSSTSSAWKLAENW